MIRFFRILQAGFCFCALLPVTLAAGPPTLLEITRIDSVRVAPLWLKDGARTVQPMTVTMWHTGPPAEGSFILGHRIFGRFVLRGGAQSFELKIPVSERPRTAALRWTVDGKALAATNVTLTPPRIRQVWLLPHSHVDIGYTDRQDKVVKHQIANLETGMELARASAGNAPGMRFKWNVEAAWTVDHFLQEATPAKRDAFVHAVQAGQVEVDTFYANLLT